MRRKKGKKGDKGRARERRESLRNKKCTTSKKKIEELKANRMKETGEIVLI
jgi:hypothetical protein